VVRAADGAGGETGEVVAIVGRRHVAPLERRPEHRAGVQLGLERLAPGGRLGE
jgi:hypothetical protein